MITTQQGAAHQNDSDQASAPDLPAPPKVLTEANLQDSVRKYREILNHSAAAGFQYARALATAAEAGTSTLAIIWTNCLCAEASFYLNENAQMQHYLDRVRSCEGRVSTPAEHCMYHTAIGTALSIADSLAASTVHLLKAAAIGRGKVDCLLSYGQALFSLAANYEQSGNYKAALATLLSVQELPQYRRQPENNVCFTDRPLSNLYQKLGDSEKARHYLGQYLKACERNNYHKGIAEGQVELAKILIEDNRLGQARSRLTRASDISMEHAIPRMWGLAQLTLVQVTMLESGPEAALHRLEDIRRQTNFNEFSLLRLNLETVSGQVYGSLGESGKACEHLELAMDIAEEGDHKFDLWKILLDLADARSQLSDVRREAALRKRAAELHDEILGARRLREVMKVELRELHLHSERELAKLSRQQEEHRHYAQGIEEELKKLALQITQRDEALRKLRSLIEQRGTARQGIRKQLRAELLATIDSSLGSEESDPLLATDLQRNYGALVARLKEHGPRLSAAEIRICLLLRLDLSTKEIAALLFKSVETIRTHRRRIRGKLNMPTEVNLVGFLMTL